MKRSALLIVLAFACLTSARAALDSVSVSVSTTSFATANKTGYLMIQKGEQVSYTVSDGATTMAGAIILLEKTRDGGGSFTIDKTLTGEGSGTVFNEKADSLYRLRISTMTAGTISLTLTEVQKEISSIKTPKNEEMFKVLNNGLILGAGTGDAVKLLGIPALPSDAAPRTNITPANANSLILNSTTGVVCLSTGTTASTWVLLTSTTSACQ